MGWTSTYCVTLGEALPCSGPHFLLCRTVWWVVGSLQMAMSGEEPAFSQGLCQVHPPTASFKPPTAPERGCDYPTSHKSTAHKCIFETQRPALCALPTLLHGDTGNGPGGTLCRWKRAPGTACRSGRGTNSVCIWGPGLLGLVLEVGDYVCSVLGGVGWSLRRGVGAPS